MRKKDAFDLHLSGNGFLSENDGLGGLGDGEFLDDTDLALLDAEPDEALIRALERGSAHLAGHARNSGRRDPDDFSDMDA